MRLPLPIATATHRSKPASSARLVNCMIEQLPQDANSPFVLTRTPGIVQWITVGDGPIQAIYSHTVSGLLFVVSGGVLYSVTSAGTATSRGTVGSSTRLDIDGNDIGIVVVNPDSAAAFSFTVSGSSFAQITDADFLGAGDVEFCDNFMLFRDPDTGVFFGADLGSLTAFDALNFATAEGAPDDLVGMKVDHRQVVLFGEESTEIWMNTGIAGFPFERLEPGFMEIGCANGRTIAKLDNSVLWLANDKTVRRLEGLTPVRISTHEIEQAIGACTLSSGRAWSYSLEGHLVYILSFTERTFAFDATTQLWHERSTYGNQQTCWEWGFPQKFGERIYVGNTTSNVIGYLSSTTYDENGLTMLMEATFQPVYAEAHRAFHDYFEVVARTGVGVTTGQGSAPEALLYSSEDGGETFKSWPNKSLGAIGKRQTRLRWSALGSSASAHGRVYKIGVSDPVPVAIHDAVLEVRGGRL